MAALPRLPLPLSPAVPELSEMGYPTGLLAWMKVSAQACPCRFWVVDNSRSMKEISRSHMAYPSMMAMISPRSSPRSARTHTASPTRWDELGDAVQSLGIMANELHARTDFHFLTSTGALESEAPQYLSMGVDEMGPASSDTPVAIGCAGAHTTLPGLSNAMARSPSGSTPLTEAVMVRLAYNRMGWAELDWAWLDWTGLD